jgi:Matrixin
MAPARHNHRTKLRPMKRLLVGSLCCLAVLGAVTDAAAFCRVTTCNPDLETCPLDDGCETGGQPLFWSSNCVTFSAQQAGSTRHGVSAAALSRELEAAFARWLSVDCGGGAHPSIEVNDLGTVACNEVEYNTAEGNANIVMFRDDEWPHPDSTDAYAQTRVLFDPDTGEIKDAEIEINGTDDPISLDGSGGVDLASVLTHEVGHFLGLAHSLDDTATMRPGYMMGDEPLTTLSQDDVDGICNIYPPNRTPASTSCEPKHGFSSECGDGIPPVSGGGGDEAPPEAGCAVSTSLAHSNGPFVIGLITIATFAMRARRRRLRASLDRIG